MVFGNGYIQIACTLVGLTTHIGSTLHVVLSAQWIYTHTTAADISRNHGQIGNLHDGEGSQRMFGNAQSMETHGVGGFGIRHGRFTHKFAVNTGYFFGFIQVQRQYFGFELFITFRTVLDEILILKPFADDVIQHHVQQCHIGSRTQLQVVFCIACQFRSAGIYHNGRFFHGKLFQFGAGYRVSFCGVGTNHHD